MMLPARCCSPPAPARAQVKKFADSRNRRRSPTRGIVQRPSDSLNALYAVDAESGATARYMTFDMRTFDMNHFQVLEGGYAIINGRVTGSFRKVDSLRRQRRSAAARRSARFARAARPFCVPRVAADSCGARANFSPARESPAVFSLRPLTCS